MITPSAITLLLVIATSTSLSNAYSIPTRSSLRSLGQSGSTTKTISSKTTNYNEKSSSLTMEGMYVFLTNHGIYLDGLVSVCVQRGIMSWSRRTDTMLVCWGVIYVVPVFFARETYDVCQTHNGSYSLWHLYFSVRCLYFFPSFRIQSNHSNI